LSTASFFRTGSVVVSVSILGTFQVAGGVTRYTITDLGTLGGARSSVDAINSLGQIVGHSTTGDGSEHHAFLYADGLMHDLGTLGGKNSWARDINDAGQIVGYALTSDGNAHAFLYDDHVMHDLGTLGGSSSEALGINDAGQVVGWSKTSTGVQHAFLYSDGVMHDLGTLGGPSSGASAINNAGVVVGSSDTGTGRRAFVYEDGAMRQLDPEQWVAGARDIDDPGKIAVELRPEADGLVQRAFVYDGAAFNELPLIGYWTDSVPDALNNRGEAVGMLYFRVYSSPYTRETLDHEPFLYSDGELWELNGLIDEGPVGSIVIVADINDSGLIVGKGNNFHAVLLTPVPEPGTAALLAGGCVLLALRKGRRRAI
jgi:probable HAF family extracellular repeat protein